MKRASPIVLNLDFDNPNIPPKIQELFDELCDWVNKIDAGLTVVGNHVTAFDCHTMYVVEYRTSTYWLWQKEGETLVNIYWLDPTAPKPTLKVALEQILAALKEQP